MLETDFMTWLLGPINPSQVHLTDVAVAWHGRLMVLVWVFLAPIAILAARFFKVMPGQDWPKQLDNPTWWKIHWMTQTFVLMLTLLAFALVLLSEGNSKSAVWHRGVGYSILILALFQISSGFFRGSKGGPTAPSQDGSLRGDHYDMTSWRKGFESLHKLIGYLTLGLVFIAILTGLYQANAPVWMFLIITIWWLFLLVVGIRLQSLGFAIDTYQAIWGDDPKHPGNNVKFGGWFWGWAMKRRILNRDKT